MKINRISFGKVIKINSSFDVARQIADIANDKNSRRKMLKNKITEFMGDTSNIKASVFDYSKNISYIFTDNESREYLASYEELLKGIDKLHKSRMSKEKKIEQRAELYEKHRERVMDIINGCYDTMTFDPKTRNGKLVSLNYIV